MTTDAATLPNDIKKKLLEIEEALVREDINEAYHILYSIADPTFTKHNPWECLQLIDSSDANMAGITSSEPVGSEELADSSPPFLKKHR